MKSYRENENIPFLIRKITCTDTEWKQWIQQQFGTGGVQAEWKAPQCCRKVGRQEAEPTRHNLPPPLSSTW